MTRLRLVTPADRYHAARALEHARQIIRENTRYGYPVTRVHLETVQAAEADYDLTTSALRP